MTDGFFKEAKKIVSGDRCSSEIYWNLKRMTIVVSWAVVVASTAVGYYYLVFLPVQEKHRLELVQADQDMRERIERAKLDQEKALQEQRAQLEERLRQSKNDEKQLDRYLLELCLQNAEKNYVDLWDRECLTRGLTADCRLPTEASAGLEDYFKGIKDECFRRFPQDQGEAAGSL